MFSLQETLLKPVQAETADGNWYFIANVANYTQYVVVEECL